MGFFTFVTSQPFAKAYIVVVIGIYVKDTVLNNKFIFLVSVNKQKRNKSEFVYKFVGNIVAIFFI